MNTSAYNKIIDLTVYVLDTIKGPNGSIIIQIIKTPSGKIHLEIVETGIVPEILLQEAIKKLQKAQRTEKAKKLSERITINWGEKLFSEESNFEGINVLETGIYHRQLEDGNTHPIQITFYLSEFNDQKKVSVSISDHLGLQESEDLALMISYDSKFKELQEKYEKKK